MDQARSDSAIASQPPTTAYRPARVGQGTETVINPERRGAALPLPEGPGLPHSSVWSRLFPSKVDYQDPALIPAQPVCSWDTFKSKLASAREAWERYSRRWTHDCSGVLR